MLGNSNLDSRKRGGGGREGGGYYDPREPPGLRVFNMLLKIIVLQNCTM